MSVYASTHWGPTLWRMLHRLAEVSDRTDVGLLWLRFLQATAEVMPCALCRHHLTQYLRTHTVMKISDPHRITGAAVRERIRRDLLTIHNDVNQRLSKPEYTYEQLQTEYSTGSRQEILLEVSQLWEVNRTIFHEYYTRRMSMTAYNTWKQIYTLIYALLLGGPN